MFCVTKRKQSNSRNLLEFNKDPADPRHFSPRAEFQVSQVSSVFLNAGDCTELDG